MAIETLISAVQAWVSGRFATKDAANEAKKAADAAGSAARNAASVAESARETADGIAASLNAVNEPFYATYQLSGSTSGLPSFTFNGYTYYKIAELEFPPAYITYSSGLNASAGMSPDEYAARFNAEGTVANMGYAIAASVEWDSVEIPISDTSSQSVYIEEPGIYIKRGSTAMTSYDTVYIEASLAGRIAALEARLAALEPSGK